MRTVVQVFQDGERDTVDRFTHLRRVNRAMVHHARVLAELAELLEKLHDQNHGARERLREIDVDFFGPTLLALIEERCAMLGELRGDWENPPAWEPEPTPRRTRKQPDLQSVPA